MITSTRATAALLPDGRRAHFQHGPIDLILRADGTAPMVREAYSRGWAHFHSILPDLVSELSLLRQPLSLQDPLSSKRMCGSVAQRMAEAIEPHACDHFITPMAAVAGAVADEMLRVLCHCAELHRVFVNNGGDIALWLAPDEIFTLALSNHQGQILGQANIIQGQGIGGIATSGRHGRSHSLGIADSVTVLAKNAAQADAAATLIANAVDLPDHPAILRCPAQALTPDSDLGNRLVTTDLGPLSRKECATALSFGLERAEMMRQSGLIAAAILFLQDQHCATGGDWLEQV